MVEEDLNLCCHCNKEIVVAYEDYWCSQDCKMKDVLSKEDYKNWKISQVLGDFKRRPYYILKSEWTKLQKGELTLNEAKRIKALLPKRRRYNSERCIKNRKRPYKPRADIVKKEKVSTVEEYDRKNAYNRKNYRKNAKEFTCPECGKVWYGGYQTKVGYCSRGCRNKYLAKMNHKLETRKCIQCGKEFQTYLTENKRYCSRECYLAKRRLENGKGKQLKEKSEIIQNI